MKKDASTEAVNNKQSSKIINQHHEIFDKSHNIKFTDKNLDDPLFNVVSLKSSDYKHEKLIDKISSRNPIQ